MTDRSTRIRLPNRRENHTEMVSTPDGTQARVSVALYENDGTPAEVFIHSDAKSGTHLAALCDDVGIIVSIALQFGVPVSVMAHALTRDENGARRSVLGMAIDAAVKAAAEGLSEDGGA